MYQFPVHRIILLILLVLVCTGITVGETTLQNWTNSDGNQVFNIRNEYHVSYLLQEIRLLEQPLPKWHVPDNSLYPKPLFFRFPIILKSKHEEIFAL